MLGSPIKYKHVFSYNITSIVEVSKTKKISSLYYYPIILYKLDDYFSGDCQRHILQVGIVFVVLNFLLANFWNSGRLKIKKGLIILMKFLQTRMDSWWQGVT